MTRNLVILIFALFSLRKALEIMFLQASGDVFFFNNFLDTSIRRSGIVLYFFHYFDSHSEVLEGRRRWSVGWRSKLVVRESDFVFLWHSLKVLESDMKKYWQDGHFFFQGRPQDIIETERGTCSLQQRSFQKRKCLTQLVNKTQHQLREQQYAKKS